MAPLREIDPQGLYHVMSRGNFRQTIFLDDDHYAKYIRLLGRVTKRRKWIVLDWCLIPNHYHLVIQLTDDGLSDGMRELNGCFSRWSNQQTGRTGTGHLVRNRFKSVGVKDEVHFWRLVTYVPLNPVSAGLAKSPADWPWSGYRATVGLEHPQAFHRPDELLRHFGGHGEEALDLYRQLVRGSHDPWSDQVVDKPRPYAA